MRRPRRPANELRLAVDCLPFDTKHAMLDGINANAIIVGAYTDRTGGVCPMLAAHRNGGRTTFASFARAWDRYTRANRGPRPATEREVGTLRAMLETSIATDERETGGGELGEAIAQHKAARARRRAWRVADAEPEPVREVPSVRRDTGERSRLAELRHRHGWAWLRLFRRYDDYAAAVRRLEDERAAEPERDRERELV